MKINHPYIKLSFTKIFSVFLFCLFRLSLCAQEIGSGIIEHFDNTNGLTQNTVVAIMEDSRGFLWFGSHDGLLRYDGYQFKVFRPDPDKPKNSLPHARIYNIYQAENKLWITTGSGISEMNLNDESFHNYMTGIRVRAIYPNGKDIFWLATNQGIYEFNILTKVHKKLISGNSFDLVLNSNFSKIFYSTSEGFFEYDLASAKATKRIFRNFNESVSFNMLKSGKITWVNVDNLGMIGLDDNWNEVKIIDFKKFFPDLKEFSVNGINNDRHGNIWASTLTGLFKYNPVDGSLLMLPSDDNKPNLVHGSPLFTSYEDHTGVIWVGSNNSGISKINLNNIKFRTINMENGLNNKFILTFCEAGDYIMVGTDGGGLNLWNRKTNTFEYILSANIQQNRIFSIIEIKPGIYWFGTSDNLVEFDLATKRISALTPEHAKLTKRFTNQFIKKIIKASDGTIWLGTQNGVVKYNPKTYQIDTFTATENELELVNTLHEDRKGNVWIGGRINLLKYDYQTKKISVIQTQCINRNILLDDIGSIFQDDDNHLWITSYTQGLAYFDIGTNKFVSYNVSDGLPNNIAYFALPKGDDIWISTNFGLSKFNKKRKTFTNYDVSDGLQNNEFNGGAAIKLSTGELAFGGVNGFNIFHPDKIPTNTYKPQVAVTEVKVMNQPFAYNHTRPIEISYLNNFISFDFAALDFISPKKNQYAYQLSGIDNDWVQSGNRHFVSYSQLPIGDYVFKVKAANSDGVWNDKPLEVKVRVTAPFWKHGWFGYTLLGLAIGGIILFFTFRLNQVKREETEKTQLNRKIAELEMRALRAQMNPHFLFNCLNSINSFILYNENQEASRYLSKFAKLIRQILDNTDKPYVPIEKNVSFLKLYVELEQLRFGDRRFDFEIKVGDNINIHEVLFPTMIVQPHIENGIWHGLMQKTDGVGKIIVKYALNEDENTVSCSIEDNGVGRAKSRELNQLSANRRDSKGTKNVLETIETLNKQYNTNLGKVITEDLYDEEKRPVGTKITITIPILEEKE
ncbi:two-component regulator propeller domain-containing protein [Emticicia sp. BO119]|uniref:ligand-binding sensor domain-containing protein n=1 Tax=Emticicia sp. BO119 TaxID=2757768 RepID=UPI0015F05B11|nr:two-component regulator propeller domain-containing protein [Emticicia sp. BO119]MBA4850914.1 histidine kinase [Emticicia sp. BO119]